MPEISAALYKDRACNFLMHNQMVMASQNEINSLYLLCQLDIVVLHHMGERNDQLALLLDSQLLHHLACELDEGQILADFLVDGVECVYPLLLSQAEEAYPQPVPLKNEGLQSLGQPPLGSFVVDVTEQPREAAPFGHVHHVLQLKIEVVVAVAGQVDA